MIHRLVRSSGDGSTTCTTFTDHVTLRFLVTFEVVGNE